jgi:hypothetical protein
MYQNHNYQCIMPSCVMLCYRHESHNTYVFYKGQNYFKIIWTRGYHIFWVYDCCKEATNVSIRYSWVSDILIFLKLTLSAYVFHYFSTIRFKLLYALYLIHEKLVDTVYIFSIESYHACLNITKVTKF